MTDSIQEDRGLVKIHGICTQMNAIWRPTPCHDLGIDGQIEFLQPGTSMSTGQILAVQSKSGPSYFGHQDEENVYFYPKEKHRRYWRSLRLPVLLVLHNPDTDLTLYARIKVQMPDHGPIAVSKKDVFCASSRTTLLHIAEIDNEVFDPQRVLSEFKEVECEREEGRIINGIDFLLASTNRYDRYFELRMCRVEVIFSLLSTASNYTISQTDYEYVLRNVLLIQSYKLTDDFLSEFNRIWFGELMVPDITVPLTKRGEDVIDALWLNCEALLSVEPYSGIQPLSARQLAEMISSIAQAESDQHDNFLTGCIKSK